MTSPVDPIAYPLRCLRRAVQIGYPWSVSPHEARALIAEVERLRGDAANWRTVRAEVLRLDGRPGMMADDDVLSVVGAVLQRAVKSGEHRREETE